MAEIKSLQEIEIKSPFSMTEGLKEWGESDIGMTAMAKKGEETKKMMETI